MLFISKSFKGFTFASGLIIALSLNVSKATKRLDADADVPMPDFTFTKKVKMSSESPVVERSLMQECAHKTRLAHLQYHKGMEVFVNAQNIAEAKHATQMLLPLIHEPFLNMHQKTAIGFFVAATKVNNPESFGLITDEDAIYCLQNAYVNPTPEITSTQSRAGILLARMYMMGRNQNMSKEQVIEMLQHICASNTENELLLRASSMLSELNLPMLLRK